MNNDYRPPFINFLPSMFSGPVIIKEIIDSRINYTLERILRADVSKYRPEAYKSEKLKNPQKIHRVALVELLSEIYFLFRFDDYY